MQLLRADELAFPPRVEKYKQSFITPIIVFAVLDAGAMGIGAGILSGSLPKFLWVVAGFLALISLIALGQARSALRPSNWVLKFDGSDIAIKYRSYLNHHFPAEDRTVALIPSSAIESVRKIVERKSLPSSSRHSGRSSGEEFQSWTYLEICLKDRVDAQALKEALVTERKTKGPKRGVVSTTHLHAPIRLISDNQLRIAWRSPRDRIVPGIDVALRNLGAAIHGEEEVRTEGESWTSMSDDRLAEYMIELCGAGQKIKAVKAIQRRYGMGLTQAKKFIDDLME